MDAPQQQFRTVIGIAFLFLLATPTKLLATGQQRVYDLAPGCLDEVETSGFLPGVGLGSDMAGLGGQAGPRTDAGTDPLLYPFTSEFGLVFDKQVAGNRVFNLNKDGVAQYGMIADHIQDIRERATPRV